MAHYEITKVKVARARADHEHVTAVELNGSANLRFRAEDVAADIEDPEGDRYYVRLEGDAVAVVAGACPGCGAAGGLTTEAAGGGDSPLLALPRFYWAA